MAFDFIKEELHEARYIRRPGDVTGRDMTDIGESFFEQLLMLQQLRTENPAFAKKYAADTLKHMNFSSVKPGATDLHNLASIINNPSKYPAVTNGGNVSFDELGFKRYLRNIINDKPNSSLDRTFLMKQQKNLAINSSMLKNARRMSADYGRTTQGERTALTARMINSQREDGKFRSDIAKNYTATAKNKKLVQDKKGLPKWVRAAAGFAAGYATGGIFT